jgi:hypothetical protein
LQSSSFGKNGSPDADFPLSNVLLNTRVLRVDQDNAIAERKLNRLTLLKIQLLHPSPLLGCARRQCRPITREPWESDDRSAAFQGRAV